MAKLRTYDSLDMLDYSSSVGELAYFDSNVLAVESIRGSTFYFGNFTYPNGERWKGTVEAIQFYDNAGDLVYDLRGIDISTKLVTEGYSRQKSTKQIFREDDAIFGSSFDDRLSGFNGNDRIAGKDGSDLLQGREGNDTIAGGDGDDKLSGGIGRDTLTGGRGFDTLIGGAKADVFVFTANSQRDAIRDFGDGKHAIWIGSGADGFRDLEISSRGDNVLIAFADTENRPAIF